MQLMRRAAANLALLVFLAGACTSDEPAAPGRASTSSQTFDEAMRIICDAPEKAELSPEAEASTSRALLLASWLDRRIHNQEARQLMGSLAATTPEGKLAALKTGAKRAGIERCALAEVWQAPAGR
jgi:hypothetical protein